MRTNPSKVQTEACRDILDMTINSAAVVNTKQGNPPRMHNHAEKHLATIDRNKMEKQTNDNVQQSNNNRRA